MVKYRVYYTNPVGDKLYAITNTGCSVSIHPEDAKLFTKYGVDKFMKLKDNKRFFKSEPALYTEVK